MEVKKLEGAEINQAIELAKRIRQDVVATYVEDQSSNYYFEEYAIQAGVDARSGRLNVWGAIDNNQLIGMCAMQNQGHITMLYVFPGCWKRGVGKELVDKMAYYAGKTLKLSKITVNVNPLWTVPFFYRCNFTNSSVQNEDKSYQAMEKKSYKHFKHNNWSFGRTQVICLIIVIVCLLALIPLIYLLIKLS